MDCRGCRCDTSFSAEASFNGAAEAVAVNKKDTFAVREGQATANRLPRDWMASLARETKDRRVPYNLEITSRHAASDGPRIFLWDGISPQATIVATGACETGGL